MLKFFIVSDIHSFYDEFISALNESGFDKSNETHWLIVLGDCFDRGPKPLETMQFLNDLPRKIIVKGNHEQMLMECINRGYPQPYDHKNGTAQTICDLAPNATSFNEACNIAYAYVKDFINNIVNYVELKNHILVHAFIPVISEDNLPAYYIHNRKFKKNDNWRNATDIEWEESCWGNPFEMAEMGLLPDKTLVFGHFHTSYAWSKYKRNEGYNEFGDHSYFKPYYGNG